MQLSFPMADCFTWGKKHGSLNYKAMDLEINGKICRVILVLWGDSDPSPTILADFNEIVYISETPVLPVHAILLEQLNAVRSRHAIGRRIANFIHKCLLASGEHTRFPRLSPLSQAPEISSAIAAQVQKLPKDRKRWISHGIDPSVFAVAPSILQLAAVRDEGGGNGEQEADDAEDGESNSHDSERSPAVSQGYNVAAQMPHSGHSAVTNVAPRHVVSILEEHGFKCAIVGSAASHIYSQGDTKDPEVRHFETVPIVNTMS